MDKIHQTNRHQNLSDSTTYTSFLSMWGLAQLCVKTPNWAKRVVAYCGLLTQVRKRIHQQRMHKKNQREGVYI